MSTDQRDFDADRRRPRPWQVGKKPHRGPVSGIRPPASKINFASRRSKNYDLNPMCGRLRLMDGSVLSVAIAVDAPDLERLMRLVKRGGVRRSPAAMLLRLALGVAALAPMGAFFSGAAHADEGLLALDSIVVNQTQSAAGQEFFRVFSANWSDSGFAKTFSLRIFERPSARFGSQITIYHQNVVLIQAFLPFNHDRIKQLAGQATIIASQKAAELQVNALFGDDPDFGPDEF